MIESAAVSVGEASFLRDRLPRDGVSESCETRPGREAVEETRLRSRDIPVRAVSPFTASDRSVSNVLNSGGAVGALGGGGKGSSFWSMSDPGDFVVVVVDEANTSTTASTFDSVR